MTKLLLPLPAFFVLAACSPNEPSVCDTAIPVVEDGWARATLPEQKMGAAYFSVRNDGDCAALLTGVLHFAARGIVPYFTSMLKQKKRKI